MTDIKNGTVIVTVEDHLAPPERAAKLTAEEVRALPKARPGVGLACDTAAVLIERAGAKLMLPTGVTAESLRDAGKKAEGADIAINDIEFLLTLFKRANLLFDAEAFTQLSKLWDQVKTQGKRDPELLTLFEPLATYFTTHKASAKTK